MILLLAIMASAIAAAIHTYNSFRKPADLVNATIGILLCLFIVVVVNIYLLTLA